MVRVSARLTGHRHSGGRSFLLLSTRGIQSFTVGERRGVVDWRSGGKCWGVGGVGGWRSGDKCYGVVMSGVGGVDMVWMGRLVEFGNYILSL